MKRRLLSLNKGAARNSLAPSIFVHRLGKLRDRSFENQRYRSSGPHLVMAALIPWNTIWGGPCGSWRRGAIPAELLAWLHLSPLGWEHLPLTGGVPYRPLSHCNRERTNCESPQRGVKIAWAKGLWDWSEFPLIAISGNWGRQGLS